MDRNICSILLSLCSTALPHKPKETGYKIHGSRFMIHHSCLKRARRPWACLSTFASLLYSLTYYTILYGWMLTHFIYLLYYTLWMDGNICSILLCLCSAALLQKPQETEYKIHGSWFMIHFFNARVGHGRVCHPSPGLSLAWHIAHLLTYLLTILYG